MAYPKIKLSDDSGNAVGVTDNRLNVNAYLAATPTIDIGDVSLLLGGTAASTNAGTMDAQTLRVTLATDDTHWGTVGTAADSDGTAHGQLRYIASQAAESKVFLGTIDADTGNIYSNTGILTDATAVHDAAASTRVITSGGEAKVIDGSSLPNAVAEGDAGRIAISRSGIQYTHLTNDSGTHSAILEEDSAHSSGDYGIMSLSVRSNTLSSLVGTNGDYAPLQVNADGALYIDVADGGQLDTIIDTLETTLTAIETDQAAIEVLLTGIDSDTDAIKTAVQILDDWDDSNYANVNINLAGSDAPTGGGTESGALRVTLANDSTGVISIDDGGNTITIDGTVTANLGTTDNAVLDAIAASLALLDNSIASGNELQVDVVAALPAGDNNIGNVDIASSVTLSVNSHAVTNAGTFATQIDGDALTALELIGDAVGTDGSAGPSKCISIGGTLSGVIQEIKVDSQGAIHSYLVAGTNAIGKLSANSGVDIGDVDVTSLPASTNTIEVVGDVAENANAAGNPVLIGGRYDSSARTLGNTDVGALALNASGHVLMDIVDGGQLDALLDTIKVDTEAIETAVELLDDTIGTDGSTGPSKAISIAGTDLSGNLQELRAGAYGELAVYQHYVGMQSDNNTGVDDTTAEALGGSQVCKRVDLQASPANTGYIYVGGSDVSATKGIRLSPGDFYSIDIDNVADIFVLASVDEEDIHFTYFT